MLRSAFTLLLASLTFTAGAWADHLELVAGGTQEAVDIAATEARLKEPFGTDFDADGNMWIVEMVSGNRLLKVNASGVLSHEAGRLPVGSSEDKGPALEAHFNGPHNLAVLRDGNLVISDTFGGRLRKVDVKKEELVEPPRYASNPPKPKVGKPFCVSLDPAGENLYVTDLRCVWRIKLATNECSLFAGNGKKGIPTDGAPAKDSPLVDPRAVAADGAGNVYILERDGHALRVVDKAGTIRTVVNTAGNKGATGDGGPALTATLNGPKHLCVDRDGSVLIADAENHLIRRYVPQDGTIQRVAGTGAAGKGEPGKDPLQTALRRPHGVTIHPRTGELYITDSYNDRVLKLVRD